MDSYQDMLVHGPIFPKIAAQYYLFLIVNLVFSPEKCVNLVFNQLTIVGEKIDEKQHLISDLQMKYQVITILLASAVISCNCILSKLCLLFVSLSI